MVKFNNIIKIFKRKQDHTNSITSAMSTKLYSSLQGSERRFRLMSIRSAPTLNDEAACTLKIFVIDQTPPFEALSYCWGDPIVTQPIKLQGLDYSVTTTLAAALRYPRRQDRPGVIWIDAICINQSDNNEKNHQVPLMREIYQIASKVHCLARP